MAKKRRPGGNPASGNPTTPAGFSGGEPGSAAVRKKSQRQSLRDRARAESQLPEVQPPDGAPYPQILRGANYLWWRSLLGVVFGLSLYLLMTSLVTQVVLGLSWVTTGQSAAYPDFVRRAIAFEVPAGMLATNLAIATLIPICWLLMAVVHQVRPRWLSSVQPRLRWRYLLISAGVAVVVFNGVTLLPVLLGAGGQVHVAAQPGFAAFLVVVILTAPIQAAAEEYFFRGYLMQALGSLVAQPWFGVVVSAVLFALMHGVQNPALFANRLGFGLLAAMLVWRTGGLEAGIGAHVVNNICAYVIAGLTSSIAEVRGTQSITWIESGIQLFGFALFAALALLVARRMNLRTRVDLAASRVV